MMTTTITHEVHIDAGKQKVWEILADYGGIENYSPTIKKSYLTSDKNGGVGATRHCDVLPMGALEERITEWREGEGYTIHLYEMSVKMPVKDVHVRFDLKGDGSHTVATIKATYSTKMEPLGAVMNAMMVRPQFRKIMPNILHGLKHHAETGEYVTIPALKAATALA